MSDSKTIGGTITGGIQDISALLPLLGTEQCEKHIGSALDGGFIYSAVTPISIFGSLGIVRASFNILVASFNVQHYQFMGAKALGDIGFTLSGTIAPMIALDPKHPKRFLAETQLEAMLTEEHIDNVLDLTVSGGEGIARWNIMLVTFTLVISFAGLAPYIGIVHDSGDTNPKALFPLGFGFPILRVFGSAACVVVAQLLIQIRIVALLKSRLLFISINRLAKVNKIEDLASEISTGLQMENANNTWAPELAAEKCIWTLQKWLATKTDTEKGENHRKIADIYAAQYEQHFGPINAPIRPWVTLLLCFGLAIGCISTVVGYIGSFFLIQHSTNPNGPLVWLVLEAILSVLRILLWAINPSWDDSKGIDFELQLSTNPPVLTCNRTWEDLRDVNNTTAHFTQTNINLEEAVAYAGPLPSFDVQDIEFYYIFAINSRNVTSRRLLIVISARKESRNRILVKEDIDHPFSIYTCSLRPLPGNPLVEFTVKEKTKPNSHFLTSDFVFMTELEAHYDKISFELQNQESKQERRKIFGKTWAMQRSLTEITNNNQQRKMEQIKPYLTDGEKAYLDHFLVERLRRFYFQIMEELVVCQINTYRKLITLTTWDTTLAPLDQIADRNDLLSFLKRHEAIETKYLLIECQRYFEICLISIGAKWDTDVWKNHTTTIQLIMKSFREETSTPLLGVSSIKRRHGDYIRKHKLEARLSEELHLFLQHGAIGRRNRTGERIDDHLKILLSDDAGREEEEKLADQMSRLNELVSDTPDSPIWDSSLAIFLKVPSDLAASFNAASPSEQFRILRQIQKTDFVREMEDRFCKYPHMNASGRLISVDDDDSNETGLDLDDEVKHMIDQVRARCRARADKLFEMFASSETIDFKRVIDSPGLTSPLNMAEEKSKLSEFRCILGEVFEEWKKRVTQSEEQFARRSAGYFLRKRPPITL